jgi:hypothetical protein
MKEQEEDVEGTLKNLHYILSLSNKSTLTTAVQNLKLRSQELL